MVDILGRKGRWVVYSLEIGTFLRAHLQQLRWTFSVSSVPDIVFGQVFYLDGLCPVCTFLLLRFNVGMGFTRCCGGGSERTSDEAQGMVLNL